MKINKKIGTRHKKLKKQKNVQSKTISSQIKAILWLALAVFILAGIQFTTQTGYLGLLLNYFFRTILKASWLLPFVRSDRLKSSLSFEN